MNISAIRVGAFACALGAVAFVGLACGDDVSEEEALANVCSDIDSVEAAEANIDGLGPEATVNDLQNATNEWVEAANELEDSLGDFLESQDDLIEGYADSLESLDDALEDVSDDDTLADAQAAVGDEYDAAIASRDAIVAQVQCP